MVKTWLLRSVVFFALICAVGLLMPTAANAKNERYSWQRYDTIDVYGGSFQDIQTTEGGSAVATFVQDEPNSRTYVARDLSDDCPGPILLEVSQNPTRATVSLGDDCNALKNYDTSVVINTLGTAIATVESEAQQIEKLYRDKECPSGPDQESCFRATGAEAANQQAACTLTHDYKKDITVANAYLDCLAGAFGVDRPAPNPDEEKKPEESCQIPGIGWVACQLVEFIATLTDNTFQLLKPFLELDPLTKEVGASPNDNSTVYKAWQTLRDIANISLVIGFFVIIYAYLTGVGVSVRNVKQLLPRLAVCAVLINVSFFLCGAIIDVSNILGRSLQELTVEFSDTTPSQSSVYKDWSSTTKRIISITPTDSEFTAEATAGMSEQEKERLGIPTTTPAQPAADGTQAAADTEPPAATAMIVNGSTIFGSLVLYANLAALVPLMVIALFAMFVTLLILLFRHAVIIVLVVVAPLAMAAYILPGTKQWFDKWRSTFIQLSLLYPIIALIFTGSTLASAVIMESAQNNGQTLLAIFSMAILVIPLIATPLILKFGGGILGQFSGMVKSAINKPRRAAIGAANNFRKDRQTLRKTRGLNDKFDLGRIDGSKNKFVHNVNKIRGVKAAIQEGRAQREEKINRDFSAHATSNLKHFMGGVSDPDLIGHVAAAEAASLKEARLKDVEAAEADFEHLGHDELLTMARSGTQGEATLNDIQRQAALRLAMKNATLAQAHELIEASHTMDEGQREELVNGLTTPRSNGKKLTDEAPHLGAGTLRGIRDRAPGSNDVNAMVAKGANANAFGGAKLNQAGADTLRRLQTVIQNGDVDAARAASIRQAATEELRGSHSGEIKHKAELRALAGI